MNNLIHLIYASASQEKFNEKEVIEIVNISYKNNMKVNITGMLLYSEGDFFQILEGEHTDVLPLFNLIKQDQRHCKIVKIIEEPIVSRDFSDWSMGYASATREQLTTLAGLNDFFNDGNCLTNLDSGRAKKLLQAFCKGIWRQKLI